MNSHSYIILLSLLSCLIDTISCNLSWSIERPYVNNILPPEFTDSTKENKIYPVVVFPDNDPLKIKLSCIKEGYRGNNDPDWTPSNLVGKVIRTVNTTHEYATWTTTITLPSDLAGKQTVRVNYEQGETVKLLEAEFHIYAKTSTSGNEVIFTQGSETGMPSDEVADEIKKQLESHYKNIGTVSQNDNTFTVTLSQGETAGIVIVAIGGLIALVGLIVFLIARFFKNEEWYQSIKQQFTSAE